jgi:hypothetical protein
MTGSRFTDGLPDDLHVAVGQAVELPLTGAMGAGNTWTARTEGDAVRADIDVAAPPRSAAAPGGPPPASTSARETLRITGLCPGSAVVHLLLGRSWEPDALAEHRLRVCVRE